MLQSVNRKHTPHSKRLTLRFNSDLTRHVGTQVPMWGAATTHRLKAREEMMFPEPRERGSQERGRSTA